MLLSICIVNYHSEDQLVDFLTSVVKYPPQGTYEVIVVDNGSSIDLKEHLQERFGELVKVIKAPRNLGFGAAQNLAVTMAKGEHVLLCNPDLELQDDSLDRLLQFASQQTDFGIIGPRLRYQHGGVQESARRFPRFFDLLGKRFSSLSWFRRHVDQYLMRDANFDQPIKVDWLVGAVMLMRRDRFQELGGFDERFFLFFEDTDLCRRAWENGYPVWYIPDSFFLHTRRRLSESDRPGMWIFKKTFWVHVGSAIKYFRKWRGR